MSLLLNYNDPRFIKLAQLIFEEQFKRDHRHESEMDERRKRLMYDDVVYNLSFLMTSVYFSDEKIFEGYARWFFDLLCNLTKDLDREKIMEQRLDHYKIMSEILAGHASVILSEDELKRAAEYLELAARVTVSAVMPCPRFDGQYKETIYWRSARGCRRWANITRRISSLKR